MTGERQTEKYSSIAEQGADSLGLLQAELLRPKFNIYHQCAIHMTTLSVERPVMSAVMYLW